jgi:predicted nuclease with TOPRIM domain
MDPEVQQRIQQVTQKFNNFIARQKSEIMKAKEEHIHGMSQLQGEHRELLKQLEDSQNKEEELRLQLERETADANGSQARITDLKIRERQLTEERKALEAQVSELREKVYSRREELSKLKQNREKQGEMDLPETIIYEQLLGFKIEGLKDDVLKLVFNNIDPRDTKKQYSLLLNVSQHLYSIDCVEPPLPQKQVDSLLSQFNENRDLPQFLKSIRQAFKAL